MSSLQDKEYRDLFVAEEIDTGLPLQIRALRKARGWSQKDLAQRVSMTQEGISRLEKLDYGRYTLATLKRLAAAYDVAIVVRFEPFSQLVDWAVNLSSEDMAVPDFEHDLGLEPTDNFLETRLTAQAHSPVNENLITPNVLLSPSLPLSAPYHSPTLTSRDTDGTVEYSAYAAD